MALTKNDLIYSLYDNAGFSKAKATALIESLLEMVKATLEGGEDIMISRFGKFYVKNKNRRKGRNPQTGNSMDLGARRVVTFRCSPALRDKINGDR